MKRFLSGLMVMSLAVAPALAETRETDATAGLDLDGAMHESLEHSPKVQKAQAAEKEMSWKQTESLSGFLPKVNIAGNHWLWYKYQYLDVNLGGAPGEFPLVFPQTDLSLNVNIPVFDGLNNVNRYSSAKSMHRSSEAEARWAEFQVSEDTRLKFFQALSAQRLADVATQNVKTLEDHYHQMQVLRRGGVATQYDLLRVEVQLHEAQSEQLQATDNVVLARQRLSEAMGLTNDTRPLQGDLPLPKPGQVQSVELRELASRPDVEALAERRDAAEHLEAANSTWLVPNISLGGAYGFYNNRNSSITDTKDYRSFYQVGVLLRWNLFDGAESLSKSHESFYQKVQAEKNLEIAKLHAPQDFEFWKRRYIYSTALYEARLSDVEKAQESVRLGNEGFRAGVRTNTDILDAELDLFRARAGVVNAQTNAAEALVNLELALGRRI